MRRFNANFRPLARERKKAAQANQATLSEAKVEPMVREFVLKISGNLS
jgi:hypothetical protein